MARRPNMKNRRINIGGGKSSGGKVSAAARLVLPLKQRLPRMQRITAAFATLSCRGLSPGLIRTAFRCLAGGLGEMKSILVGLGSLCFLSSHLLAQSFI